MIFSSKIKKSELHMGIAVGTGSVQAILYYHYNNVQKPRILKVITRPTSVMPMVDFDALSRYARNEIKEISRMVSAEHITGIRHINVLFSPPWYFSQTRLVHIERPEPFRLSEELLKNIIREERDMFIRSSHEQFSAFHDHGNYEVIELSIMKVLMNGYEVDHFLNKYVRDIVLYAYMSMSAKDLIDQIRHAVTSVFSSAKVEFHSVPYTFFRSIKQMASHPAENITVNIDDGFILVEIGGEITEITVFRKGVIEETFSFGRGMHFILRRTATAMRIAPADAMSLIKSFDRKEISEAHNEKLGSVLSGAFDEWRSVFENILKEASHERLLPGAMLLCGEGALLEKFHELLTGDYVKEYVVQNKSFDVTVLAPPLFRSFFDGEAKEFAGGPAVAALYALSLPLNIARFGEI